MSDPELLVSQADGVLSITLNRPGAANAITADMREGIIAALGDAGRHARSTVGVPSLPLDAAVEVEAMIEIS